MQITSRLLSIVNKRTLAKPVSLCRIGIGIASILMGYLEAGNLQTLYSPGVVRAKEFAWLPDIPLYGVTLYAVIWIVCGVAFSAGMFTSLSGILLAGCIWYSLLLDMNLYSNHLYLLGIMVPLLTIAKSGSALSFDSHIRGKEDKEVPYYPCFLIKFQLSVVYFYAAVQKINPDFLSGAMVEYAFVAAHKIPYSFVFQGLAIGTIVLEMFLAFALWNRRLQRPAFTLGFLLHLMIPFLYPSSFSPLVAFSILILSPYVLFLKDEPTPRLVIWDDSCSFCYYWISAFKMLDWFRTFEFAGASDVALLKKVGITPAEADSELKLKVGDETLGGYDAVSEILASLPGTFFLASVLFIRPVRAMGQKAYRAVAMRRKCAYVPGCEREPSGAKGGVGSV